MQDRTSASFFASAFVPSTRAVFSVARCMNFICSSLLEKAFLPGPSPDIIAGICDVYALCYGCSGATPAGSAACCVTAGGRQRPAGWQLRSAAARRQQQFLCRFTYCVSTNKAGELFKHAQRSNGKAPAYVCVPKISQLLRITVPSGTTII